MFRKTLIISAIVLMMASVSSAGEADGGYAGAFLQVPIGARPTAMGGAYIAVSDDGSAPLYNPAGLSGLERTLISTSYRVMQLDRTLGYAAFYLPVAGESVIGGHWLYAGSGSVTARDHDGYALDHEFSFDNHDFSVLFAKRFEKYLSIGVRLNYYYAKMPEVSASSVGFDFGAMFHLNQLVNREKQARIPVKEIRVGLTLRNIEAKFPWSSESYNLAYNRGDFGYEQTDAVPIQVGLGASAKFLKRKLLVAADMSKNAEQSMVGRIGSEYMLNPQLALRAGYGDGRFAAGTGYNLNFSGYSIRIDYAFSTDKADEGSEHIFSFDLFL